MRAKNPPKPLVASLVGMFLFIGAATILFLPYNYKWYVLHRYLMIPSRLIIGWVYALMLEVGWFFRVRQLELLYVIVAAVSGFVVGGLVYFFWTRHWIGKILVVIFVLLQFLLGGFLSLFAGDFVRTSAEVCRVDVMDDVGIKILGYGTEEGSSFDNYFVLSTIDDGNSWQQAMVQSYDSWDGEPDPPDCEGEILHFETLPNNELIWMWTTSNLSVSDDGGGSWRTWRPSCGIRERCNYYGSISTVKFEDTRQGHIQIDPYGNGPTTDIISSDGGLTWSSKLDP